MIVFKYNKVGNARYISHKDMLKIMERTLRRAGFEVGFSQGFNPHMNIYYSPPIALGLGSIAEYAAVEIRGVEADEFLKRYNKAAPKDVQATEAYFADKNPNFAKNVKAFVYEIKIEGSSDALKKIEELGQKNADGTARKEYTVSYTQQGKDVSKEVSGLIYGITNKGGGIFEFQLAAGEKNLRPDRLAKQFEKDFGVQISIPAILKTAQIL